MDVQQQAATELRQDRVHQVHSSTSSSSRSKRRCSTRSRPGTVSSVSQRPRYVRRRQDDDENSHKQRLVAVLWISQVYANHQLAVSASARTLSTSSSQAALYTVDWTTATSCSQNSRPVTRHERIMARPRVTPLLRCRHWLPIQQRVATTSCV